MKNSKNLSVVIPTIQKDVNTLNNLVSILVNDEIVKEVIIIDNSLKGFHFDNEKVRIIIPDKNLFVNPSWNLGVKEAKNEYVCLANDDIKIAQNFCSKILENFTDKYGIIGMNEQEVIDTRDIDNNVVIDINNVELNSSEEIAFEPITFRPTNFGIMMFFKKETYVEIPEDLKIYFGDDWLIYQAKKKKKINATCVGQKVYHLGSLSSSRFMDKLQIEEQIYLKHVMKYRYLFDYFEDKYFRRWFILGLKIKKRKK